MATSLKLLNKITGNKGYYKHLLGAKGWTEFRNFPTPTGKTFQKSYQQHTRNHHEFTTYYFKNIKAACDTITT